jgi:hypothetical protein
VSCAAHLHNCGRYNHQPALRSLHRMGGWGPWSVLAVLHGPGREPCPAPADQTPPQRPRSAPGSLACRCWASYGTRHGPAMPGSGTHRQEWTRTLFLLLLLLLVIRMVGMRAHAARQGKDAHHAQAAPQKHGDKGQQVPAGELLAPPARPGQQTGRVIGFGGHAPRKCSHKTASPDTVAMASRKVLLRASSHINVP